MIVKIIENGTKKSTMMALMKLITIISLLAILAEAKPVDQLTIRFVNNLITKEKLSELCNFSTQLQDLLHNSKDAKDQEIFKDSLKFINEVTRGLDNYDCQPPVIATLVTTTTETTTKILEYGEMTETGTELTPLKPTTEKIEEGFESMCDDCELDYNGLDGAKIAEFSEVLDEIEVRNTGYGPKTILMLSMVGICGIVLLGIMAFTCVKLVSCFF